MAESSTATARSGFGATMRRDAWWVGLICDWNPAVESKPKDPVVYFGRGITHWMAGNLELAKDDLDRAVKLSPELTEFQRALALILREKEEVDDGREA